MPSPGLSRHKLQLCCRTRGKGGGWEHRRRSDWNSGGTYYKSLAIEAKTHFPTLNASNLVLKILQHDKIWGGAIPRSKFWGGDFFPRFLLDLRPWLRETDRELRRRRRASVATVQRCCLLDTGKSRHRTCELNWSSVTLWKHRHQSQIAVLQQN